MWAIGAKIQEAGKWPVEDPAAVTWKSCLVVPVFLITNLVGNWSYRFLTEPLFGIEYLGKKKQKHKRKRFQQATRYESAARVYHVFGHWPFWSFYDYIHRQISSNCILPPSSSFAFSECQHALTCQVALATSIATLQSPQGKSRNHMLGPAPLGVFHLLCRDPATHTIAAYQRISKNHYKTLKLWGTLLPGLTV